MQRRLSRLTSEILTLKRTAERDLAETVMEIGQRLREVRGMLERGEWLDWLEEDMPFSDQAARNYERVAMWAKAYPALFQQWKVLGPTKLYAIATLEGPELRELRRRKRHQVPGTEQTETLEEMSAPQVHALVASMRSELPERPPIGRLVGAFRRRVRGLLGATKQLMTRRREVDREAAEALHGALLEAAEALERGFRL